MILLRSKYDNFIDNIIKTKRADVISSLIPIPMRRPQSTTRTASNDSKILFLADMIKK